MADLLEQVSLTRQNGATCSASSLRNRVVLVYFSASWCPPCRRFTPLLKIFYEKALAQGEDIEIVFVSRDRSEDEAKSYFREHHGPWLMLQFQHPLGDQLMRALGIRGIPSLHVINEFGYSVVDNAKEDVVQNAQSRLESAVADTISRWRTQVGIRPIDDSTKSFRSLLHQLGNSENSASLSTIYKLLQNIVENPMEEKYKRIKTSNESLKNKIFDVETAVQVLRAAGWEENGEDSTVWIGPSNLTPAHVLAVSEALERSQQERISQPADSPMANLSPEEFQRMARQRRQLMNGARLTQAAARANPQLQQTATGNPRSASGRQRITAEMLREALTGAMGMLAQGGASSQRHSAGDEKRLRKDHFIKRLESGVKGAEAHGDPSAIAKACSVIPIARLEEKGNGKGTKATFIALLDWFKTEFFQWFDAPMDSKGNKMELSKNEGPNAEEIRMNVSRVEVYCSADKTETTRFPRVNDPAVLLDTRKGRCGEWANCFTLCANAMGFRARQVLDWTDHTWTEVFLDEEKRWIHADPCENVFDEPLLYEKGWGKKLSYCVSFDFRWGPTDTTKRYTRKWAEVLERRQEILEEDLDNALRMLRSSVQHDSNMSSGEKEVYEEAEALEIVELLESQNDSGDGSEQLPGRETGSLEWRRARGELGEHNP